MGTPPGEDGSADLKHVLAVAREVGRHMNEPKIVVTKSTVPVGTAEKVRAAVKAETNVSLCGVLQPGVPEGRRRDRGLHEARSRRGGRGQRGGQGGHGRAVRPVHPAGRQSGALHGYRLGRGDEVRGQCHAGDPHLLHESDRAVLRAGGRRRQQCAPGHRIGPADRAGVPVSRTRDTAAPAFPRT